MADGIKPRRISLTSVVRSSVAVTHVPISSTASEEQNNASGALPNLSREATRDPINAIVGVYGGIIRRYEPEALEPGQDGADIFDTSDFIVDDVETMPRALDYVTKNVRISATELEKITAEAIRDNEAFDKRYQNDDELELMQFSSGEDEIESEENSACLSPVCNIATKQRSHATSQRKYNDKVIATSGRVLRRRSYSKFRINTPAMQDEAESDSRSHSIDSDSISGFSVDVLHSAINESLEKTCFGVTINEQDLALLRKPVVINLEHVNKCASRSLQKKHAMALRKTCDVALNNFGTSVNQKSIRTGKLQDELVVDEPSNESSNFDAEADIESEAIHHDDFISLNQTDDQSELNVGEEDDRSSEEEADPAVKEILINPVPCGKKGGRKKKVARCEHCGFIMAQRKNLQRHIDKCALNPSSSRHVIPIAKCALKTKTTKSSKK